MQKKNNIYKEKRMKSRTARVRVRVKGMKELKQVVCTHIKYLYKVKEKQQMDQYYCWKDSDPLNKTLH